MPTPSDFQNPLFEGDEQLPQGEEQPVQHGEEQPLQRGQNRSGMVRIQTAIPARAGVGEQDHRQNIEEDGDPEGTTASDSAPTRPALEERFEALAAVQVAQGQTLRQIMEKLDQLTTQTPSQAPSAPAAEACQLVAPGATSAQSPAALRSVHTSGTISTASGTSLSVNLPTPKLPEFKGEPEENITRWARTARGALAHYGDEPVRVAIAAQALRGNAQSWYAIEVEKDRKPDSLDQLLERLITRYQVSNPEEKAWRELESFRQHYGEGAEAYFHRLEEAVIDLPELSEILLLQFYLRGLRKDWREKLEEDVRGVRLQQPMYKLTLQRAREAIASIELSYKGRDRKGSAKAATAVVNAAVAGGNNKSRANNQVSQEEFDRCYKLGICSRCKEPWERGHKCAKDAPPKKDDLPPNGAGTQ